MSEESVPSSRIAFGLVIVAIGVLFTLDNLDLVEIDEFWQYWPAALLLIGAGKLFGGAFSQGLFWIVAGAVLLLPTVAPGVDWNDLTRLWPLVLVFFGVRMVWESFGPAPAARSRRPRQASSARLSSFLYPVRQALLCEDFNGADLAAFLGACELDLSEAKLAENGAAIAVFAFWGGVTVIVPDDWPVDVNVSVLMGVTEDQTRATAAKEPTTVAGVALQLGRDPGPSGADAGRPRLQVRGFVMMGGVEVRNP